MKDYEFVDGRMVRKKKKQLRCAAQRCTFQPNRKHEEFIWKICYKTKDVKMYRVYYQSESVHDIGSSAEGDSTLRVSLCPFHARPASRMKIL